MNDSPLPVILVLLAASVFVVTLARRLGLPAILGYVTVGLILGPHAMGAFPESDTTHLLAELGVVFLLFTLGLEFSWPRMVALRREVFGLGVAAGVRHGRRGGADRPPVRTSTGRRASCSVAWWP